MSETRCGSPAIFARWGRDELADVYRCDHAAGHKGFHCARDPRSGVLTSWGRSYPTPTPERIRAAETAAAELTPELEATVLADEEQRHAAWRAANPEKVREARELAERLWGPPTSAAKHEHEDGHR